MDIIIVNYNSTNYLLNCLRSVEKNLNGLPAKIFVQDNASTDGTDKIRSEFPQVILTMNQENLGFARAVNQALKQGTGDYVVLLNPDTCLTDNFFDICINFMNGNQDVGIMGPKILDSDGRLQNSARAFPTPLTAFFGRSSFLSKRFPKNPITSRNLLSLKSDGKSPMKVDWVSGACMVVRRKAMNQVGLLDEQFFMYWEDTDWCKRMWEHQWKVVYNPQASVYHYVGGSSDKLPIRSRYEFHKSVYLLFDKHYHQVLTLFRPLAIGALSFRFIFMVLLPYGIRHLSDRLISKQKDKTGTSVFQMPLHVEKQKTRPKKRIRVLHIITRLIVGGAQETAMLTADMLDNSRWNVHLLSGPQTGPEGSLIESVRERGLRLVIEPWLVREISPIKDLKAIIRLRRFIRRGHYVIVHTNSSKAGILGRWAAWLAKTPIIVHTVHGWGFHDHQTALERMFYINLEKWTLPITDKLVAVTQRDIRKGIRSGIGHSDDYVVVRSGIELDRFGHPEKPREQTRATWGISPDTPIVGTVTRLSQQKAPLDLIRAMDIIAQSVPKARFVIVGDGPLREDVETLIAELGLEERVILTGLRRDIPDLMAAFDMFLLPSLWEGLPRVIPQAMAHGLPIVASAVDGNAEAVIDRVTGRLVPPADHAKAAEAVIELLNDPLMAARMGASGRDHVAEFGAKKMVEQIAKLYDQLISKELGIGN